jgi:hypothetical protein
MLTHKEFTIIAQENAERTHDRNEQEAMYAIMYAAAERGKGKKGKLPKISDLYNRDSLKGKTEKEDNTIEDLVEKQEHTKKWLEQFDLSGLNAKSDGEGR